ncbi:MAG: macro domain-containing protein [Gammaproteobacteria bacterium]
MSQQSMQFLYGDRELRIEVCDLLKAPTEVIVNPANGSLQHGGGLAATIAQAAGAQLQRDSDTLVQEYGELESGMAVYTGAGQLPYTAVIHAVGPMQGEGDEQHKLEQAVLRSLLLCEANDWHSIAFPAISAGVFRVPIEICAQAFFRAITHFWDARQECALEKIHICLTDRHFQAFFDAFREDAHIPATEGSSTAITKPDSEPTGYIELDEQEVNQGNEDIEDWFK